MSKKEQNSEKEVKWNSCWGGLILIYGMPIIFFLMVMWGIPTLIDSLNRVRIDSQYTIEYMESRNTKCLYNGAQILVCDPKVAYWNKDSLLVSDGYNCYLFELGKITYKDGIEEIPCGNLKKMLWQQPVEVWREE